MLYSLSPQCVQDLGTGLVAVSRSPPDAEGGYQWTVTFSAQDRDVPEFSVKSDLTGEYIDAYVDTVNTPPPHLYGSSSVFTRTAATGTWQEQMTLKPSDWQGADLYGLGGVAIGERYVAVGAPNRDTYVEREESTRKIID